MLKNTLIISKIKWLGAILIIGFMMFAVGCNGGSDGESDNSNPKGETTVTPPTTAPSVQVYTEDIFVSALQDNEITIPIEQRAFRSDGEPVLLDDVRLLNNDNLDCYDVNFTDDKIYFNTDTTGICVYEYSVNAPSEPETRSVRLNSTHSDSTYVDGSSLNTKTTAHAYIVVQPKNTAVRSSTPLPIISVATTGNADLVVDIKNKLGTSFPSNATLNTGVTVLGSGTASVKATAKTVTFSGGSSGATRLVYSLTGTDGTVYLGVVDITLSTQGANKHPVFTDFTHTGTGTVNLVKSEITGTVDIANYIKDADTGQSMQIIEYRGFNITLTPAATSPSATKFDFKVKQSGVYYVSVTITDHHGGYTTGLVEINAKSMFEPITVNKLVFLPPITFTEAQYAGFSYTASYKETSGTGPQDLKMAVVSYDIADAICKSKGALLPTKAQMELFKNQEKTTQLWGATSKQWPIGKPYFTSATDDITVMYQFTPLTLGAVGTETSIQNALGYVSCVDMTPVSLSIDNENIYIKVTDTMTASFKTASGLTYPYMRPITWSVTNGGAYVTLVGDKVAGKSAGTATFKAVSYNNLLTVTKNIPVSDQPVIITGVVNGEVYENMTFVSEKAPTANQSVTWSASGADAALVTVNTSTGVVSMVARDYENPQDTNKDNVYSFNLTATSTINSNTASQAMTITVNNIKEVSGITVGNITNQKVNENNLFTSPTPTVTGGSGSKITWTVGGADASKVSINSANGVVSMVARDYEKPVDANGNNVYEVIVTATDGDDNSESTPMTITVLNVEENANIVLGNIANATVYENKAFTSSTPTATGGNGTITWTVRGNDASKVSINSVTGVVSMVARNYESPVDNGKNNVYDITLRATDWDGNIEQKAMTITVINVKETVPVYVGNVTDHTVDSGKSFTLPTPTVTGGVGGAFTWTVGGSDAKHVSINGSTGVVTMPAKDYENPVDLGKNNTYYFTIRATDADGNNRVKEVTITIKQTAYNTDATIGTGSSTECASVSNPGAGACYTELLVSQYPTLYWRGGHYVISGVYSDKATTKLIAGGTLDTIDAEPSLGWWTLDMTKSFYTQILGRINTTYNAGFLGEFSLYNSDLGHNTAAGEQYWNPSTPKPPHTLETIDNVKKIYKLRIHSKGNLGSSKLVDRYIIGITLYYTK